MRIDSFYRMAKVKAEGQTENFELWKAYMKKAGR
jgi:hypothetical protein